MAPVVPPAQKLGNRQGLAPDRLEDRRLFAVAVAAEDGKERLVPVARLPGVGREVAEEECVRVA